MANPDWAINLLERSETLADILRRNSMTTSSSLSNFRRFLTNGFQTSEPLPPGRKYHSLKHCAIINFAEGCCIGGGISMIVSVIPAVLKGNIRRALKDVPTLGNLRVALFFGMFMSSCNSGLYLQRVSAHDPGLARSEFRRLRFLIGLVAGMSVAVLPKGVRRFILYLLLTRAIEIAARLAKAELKERKLRSERKTSGVPESSTEGSTPLPCTIAQPCDVFSSHEVVGLASVSMAVIITAWFRFTHLVPSGYLHFLAGINNLTAKQVSDVQSILKGNSAAGSAVAKVVSREDRICSVYHPHEQGCMNFYLEFLLKGILTKSGPFYFKLYLVPLLFSIAKRRGKNVSPELAFNFLKRVWWSSLFLGTMNATAAGAVCAMSKFRPYSYHPKISLVTHASFGGYMCGLSLYLEQDSRRLELALYLFGQAIQILVNAYKASGVWYPGHMDSIVTAVSISLMLFAFWEEADRLTDADEESLHIPIIRPGYASLIARIIDTKTTRHSFRIFRK